MRTSRLGANFRHRNKPCGISGIGREQSFQAGNVLCYEPQLTSGNQSFFVQDTFLITAAGHEVLNPALPYSPADIERAMSQSLHSVK